MIGLDTNVLVRYLTQDNPPQARLATELIERRLSEQDPGFISVVAMVETVWVLDRAYGLSAAAIAGVIEPCCRRLNWSSRTSRRCSLR
jgi:predicted nucleic-acid-binding protein